MKKEVLALALAFVMLTLTAAPALASAQVTKNEIVYATYDADGGNAAYSVVNRFEVGSAQQLTDYGVYQQVTNLTSTAPPARLRRRDQHAGQRGRLLLQGRALPCRAALAHQH